MGGCLHRHVFDAGSIWKPPKPSHQLPNRQIYYSHEDKLINLPNQDGGEFSFCSQDLMQH
jgi:hypothetical protein